MTATVQGLSITVFHLISSFTHQVNSFEPLAGHRQLTFLGRSINREQWSNSDIVQRSHWSYFMTREVVGWLCIYGAGYRTVWSQLNTHSLPLVGTRIRNCKSGALIFDKLASQSWFCHTMVHYCEQEHKQCNVPSSVMYESSCDFFIKVWNRGKIFICSVIFNQHCIFQLPLLSDL